MNPDLKLSFPLITHRTWEVMFCQTFPDGRATFYVLDDLEFLLGSKDSSRFLLITFHSLMPPFVSHKI